jgi:hypothetical protein
MFGAIPIKIPMACITETEKSTPKFIWKHKRRQITKEIISQKRMLEVSAIPEFKLYYRATTEP